MKKLIIILMACLLYSCNPKTKDMKFKDFDFYTEYNQFYITSDNNEFLKGQINGNKEAYDSRLSVENNALVIFTQSYGRIKGDLEVLEHPNQNSDYSKFDHIVEGGINIESGELRILNCPDSHMESSIKVDPGKYRVRIYSSNLDSVNETDLANDTDDDYYRIELWKSDDMERKVLKQYNIQ